MASAAIANTLSAERRMLRETQRGEGGLGIGKRIEKREEY